MKLIAGSFLAACTVALALASATGMQAQDNIAQHVRQVGNGTVTLVFQSKPGVCGNGKNNISIRSEYDNRNYRWDDYRHSCEEGPVQAELTVKSGEVVSMETYVAGAPRDGQYRVGSRAATAYLLDLARNSDYSRVAKKAIFATIIADSVEPYRELIAIARLDSRPTEVRKDAIFWLGQAAGEKVVGDVKSLTSDENTEVKKSAVFALSQMRNEESLNALMDVAKTTKDPEVRKSALFWLAQKNDPRVLAVFEDILLKH